MWELCVQLPHEVMQRASFFVTLIGRKPFVSAVGKASPSLRG